MSRVRIDLRDVRRPDDESDSEQRLPQERGAPFRIEKIRALRGGGEEVTEIPATFATRQQAIEAAERTQVGCFDACQPVRVFVADRSGVRVYRATGDRELIADEPQPRGRERLERSRVP
ncbi:MAG: hypothetical protein ACYCT1_05040 [Steroidobacteraceae bacterium]